MTGEARRKTITILPYSNTSMNNIAISNNTITKSRIRSNPGIFSYNNCSTYTVSLNISDNDGNTDSCSSLIFVSIMGDINQDCNLDILDIVNAINMILYEGDYNSIIDLNNDQSVDILDVVLMVNAILISN